MTRSRTVLIACAVLAAGLPARAAEVDKYLPNDSEIVASVNVRQLLDSPLVKKYALAHIQEYLKQSGGVQDVLTAVGFDPLKDVSLIVAGGPSAYNTDRGLVVVHGRFDTDKVRAKAEEIAKDKADALKVHAVGGYTVYEATGPKVKNKPASPVFVGLLNGTTLVASRRQEYVIEAFDKEAGKKETTLKKGIERLVSKADAGHTVWVSVPSHTLNKGGVAKQPQAQKVLAKCDAITLGVNVADDITTEIVLAAKDAEAAKSLTTELRDGVDQLKGLVGFFVSQGNNQFAPVIEVLGSTKVGAKGARVSIKSHVGADLIDKALKQE